MDHFERFCIKTSFILPTVLFLVASFHWYHLANVILFLKEIERTRRREMKLNQTKQTDRRTGRQTKKRSKAAWNSVRPRELNELNIKMPFELVKWQHNTTNWIFSIRFMLCKANKHKHTHKEGKRGRESEIFYGSLQSKTRYLKPPVIWLHVEWFLPCANEQQC